MGCLCTLATSVVRLVVFVFNFLIVVLGLTLLTLGILYKLKVDSIVNFADEYDLSVAPTMFIVLGIFLFVVSFFGCCGAFKENSCMLRTWAAILVALLILELVGCYFAFKYLDDDTLKKQVTESFENAVKNYDTDKNDKEMVDSIQIALGCCGVNGPKDYKELPQSCCGLSDNAKEKCRMTSSELYKEGCPHFITDAIDQISSVLGSIAIVTAIVLIAGIFFGCCLSCR